MSIRTIVGERVAFYDSVTEWAFGPTFSSEEDADSFLSYAETKAGVNARLITEGYLGDLHREWIELRRAAGADI